MNNLSPADYSEIGRKAKEEGRFGDALEACLKMLELEPENPQTLANMASLYAQMSNQTTAYQLLKRARDLAPRDPRRQNDLVYFMNHLPVSAGEHFNEHRRFQSLCAEKELPLPPRKVPRKNSRVRIGYVSADLHEHATAFILEPILSTHDKNRFEIYLYSTEPTKDTYTERFMSLSNVFREAWNLTPHALRAMILEDEIDILVDLGGHTGGNSLPVFALRAAPVQVSWFSYMNTTGLSTMDYRLTDRLRITPEQQRYYTEKLIFLSNSYTFRSPLPPPPNISVPSLARGFPTFGSFNTSWKISTAVIDLWAHILKGVPSARLLMIVPKGEEYNAWILNQFEYRDIERERITTENVLPLPSFLNFIREVDIALDPFPYTGGATTYHALSQGVPTITLRGTTEYAQNSAAILINAGLSDFVTNSPAEYVERAVQNSRDIKRLETLRKTLPSRVGDTTHELTREIEVAFLRMLQEKLGVETSK